ncbi:TetR/AcrR family transcriptional regulator [Rugamonas sp.]|uniref:TetR/AcrR family transcriptional regulator n=1 Tax=Rugamonas sp. TaxID=1926287 RepID=UPI0025CD1BD9|nr:TetR/AcrR family transcriptional regulator [Rugamonas sp.]
MSKNADTPLRNKESNTTSKGYERAGAILDVARVLLANHGYAALSMRSVALRLGVSLSNVQHYYPSRDALIEALLVQTFDRYQAGIDERVAQLGKGARLELFKAVIDYFLDDLRDPISCGLFFEISALANRHAYAAQIFDKMMTRARKTLRNLIKDIAPHMTPRQCEIRGALIVSQMIGTMLFISDARPRHAELKGLLQEANAAVMRIAFAA